MRTDGWITSHVNSLLSGTWLVSGGSWISQAAIFHTVQFAVVTKREIDTSMLDYMLPFTGVLHVNANNPLVIHNALPYSFDNQG